MECNLAPFPGPETLLGCHGTVIVGVGAAVWTGANTQGCNRDIPMKTVMETFHSKLFSSMKSTISLDKKLNVYLVIVSISYSDNVLTLTQNFAIRFGIFYRAQI